MPQVCAYELVAVGSSPAVQKSQKGTVNDSSQEPISAVNQHLRADRGRQTYPVTLKASRSRPLIQAGSVPRPAHVAPVAGSR